LLNGQKTTVRAGHHRGFLRRQQQVQAIKSLVQSGALSFAEVNP
jgi:hypothetical protein